MHAFASPARFSRALGTALLAMLTSTTGAALASPDYPSILKREVPMLCTPDCMLCHATSPGVIGNIDKDFALDMNELWGLVGKSPDVLVSAIAQSKTAMHDTDLDGQSDMVELDGSLIAMGTTGQLTTDPNIPEGVDAPSPDICPPEPKYGCGAAHVTPRAHVHADYVLWALFGGLLAFGLWRRFSARPPG